MTWIHDLPVELVGKIMTGIPTTCLRAVRTTCKSWNSISKEWFVAAARQHDQFLGFMNLGYKLCSVRCDLQSKDYDISINQVTLFDQVEISNVFHVDGLVFCVTKDNKRLVVWNPYLEQTRWIEPRKKCHSIYAIGYDSKKHNHKILSIYQSVRTQVEYEKFQKQKKVEYEIYDLSSDSWRVFVINPDWKIEYQRGVTLKGNSYFFATEEMMGIDDVEDGGFLLCFDFTSEKFGKRLDLPFHCREWEDIVTLSWVSEERLGVLYKEYVSYAYLEIWITNKIEPNAVSWSKFLSLSEDLLSVEFQFNAESFFIDEEKKVAVVFDVTWEDDHHRCAYSHVPTAFMIGKEGIFKSVKLGGNVHPMVLRPLVSSFYLPSLVQINKKLCKRKKDMLN